LAVGTDSDSPQLQRETLRNELYEAYHSVWCAAASFAPTVMVLDDLLWADPASVELMIELFPLVDEVPLLLLCSFRPERQSRAWRVKQTAETDYPHLIRGVTERRKRGKDDSSTDQEPVPAVASQVTAPNVIQRPPTPVADMPALPPLKLSWDGKGNWER